METVLQNNMTGECFIMWDCLEKNYETCPRFHWSHGDKTYPTEYI